MALILKNGAVFLHIPKTGGNWITNVLRELDLIETRAAQKHADIDHFFAVPKQRKALLKYAFHELYYPQKKKQKPFMFCFVRNPLSWYESWFKYMSQPSRQWRFWGKEQGIYKWHPNSMLNGVGHTDFSQFVRNMSAKRPGYVTEMFGWYTKPHIDFIGKQENLVEDLVTVLKTMDLDFNEEFVRNFGKIGVSPEPRKKIIWPDELKKEIALHEYAGMIRYGYHTTLKELGLDIDRLTQISP